MLPKMLDDLAAPVENLRPRLQTGCHAVEHRLVLQARNPAQIGRAARMQRTCESRRRIAVIDLLQKIIVEHSQKQPVPLIL
jgi:hypothetical protein